MMDDLRDLDPFDVVTVSLAFSWVRDRYPHPATAWEEVRALLREGSLIDTPARIDACLALTHVLEKHQASLRDHMQARADAAAVQLPRTL